MIEASFDASADASPVDTPTGEWPQGSAGTAALVSRPGDALTSAQLYGLLRLRVDVFVVEQQCPYPELDGQDLLGSTRHLWTVAAGGTAQSVPGAEDGTNETGEVTGCLRILAEPGGKQRIGRVCTAASVRGTGVGARLMRAALDLVGENDCVLDAQTYASGFYARFGFGRVGPEFTEDGIAHVTMRRPGS